MADSDDIDLRDVYDFTKDNINEYIGDTKKTIINQVDQAKKTFWDIIFVVLIDWKVIFFVLLTLTLILAYVMKKIYDSLINSQAYNPYGTESFNFFGHFLIINCFIAIFTICYYFYKRSLIGKKGPRGKIGKKGPQGKNQTCDICTLKPSVMKRDTFEDDSNEEIEIDNSLFNQESNLATKKWKSYNINKTLGQIPKCKSCQVIRLPYINYIRGLIGNINENGIIDSLQYLYDYEDKIKLLGKKEGVIGSKNKNNVEKIKCPKNCGIFKMDVAYDNAKKGIAGIQIFCRNYKTGEVKLPKKTILGTINNSHQVNNVFCPNNKALLGGLEGYHDTKQPLNLKFGQCNYLS